MEEASVDFQCTEIHAAGPLHSQPISVECEGETPGSSKTVNIPQRGIHDTACDSLQSVESVADGVHGPHELPLSRFEDLNEKVGKLSVEADSGPGSPHLCNKGPDEYQLKWILWHDRNTPIVTQNQNGPCPLIAIANILLLRGKIKLLSSTSSITAEELVTHVANNIVESRPEDTSEDVMRNFEQNMHDAMSLLPQLHTGLDVNIKFTGVNHFEFTEACTVFDLLNISLYHGWVVDPQAVETVHALGNMGYNQLVEMIIQDKVSEDASKVTRALLAEQFLETSASQLTYHGLCELNSVMADNELAVLFRNNHFSTIYKRRVPTSSRESTALNGKERSEVIQNELFLLVTDQGFLHEYNVAWEMLCNIEGDSMFVDSNFKTVPPKSSLDFSPSTKDNLTMLQIDQDYMVALALQEDMQRLDESWEDVNKANPDEDASEQYDNYSHVIQKTVDRGMVETEYNSREPQLQQSAKTSQTSLGCTCGGATSENHQSHQPSCASLDTEERRSIPSTSPTSSHKKNTCSVL